MFLNESFTKTLMSHSLQTRYKSSNSSFHLHDNPLAQALPQLPHPSPKSPSSAKQALAQGLPSGVNKT
jgi:hypothetical protein